MCTTDFTFPDSVTGAEPSPKSIVTLWMALPVVGGAVIVNVTGVPTVGVPAAATSTVSCGFGVTVIEADVVEVSPNASKPVMTTRYEPGAPYAWVMTFGWPV